ncbi:ras GEF [Teratosphaeria nubilosa]|uniref:Ras GEF n=1 Tax=Teratosphaeria nubilosa TaxID=161662 RepID=A0A6G1L5T0_9PEZI|nr:ras GEF [Teratosphaeria nubilosa]
MNGNGQDEDELVGVVGAVRSYSPFQSPESSLTAPLHEVNIAIVGAPGVGKSTLMHKALDLPPSPTATFAERKIPIDGGDCLVRLIEIPIEDVDIDEDDDTVVWPATIEDKMMPEKIDGAMAVYDVGDRGSFEDMPEVLNAFRKSSLPSILISAKCDTPRSNRELDPTVIERKARGSISGLDTIQLSETGAENHRQALSMILQSILGNAGDEGSIARSSSVNRQRAQSTAVRPVSPKPPSGRGHARASSEYRTTSVQKHARHESSTVAYASNDRLRVPADTPEGEMHRSFLLEESGSEASLVRPASSRSSVSGGANASGSGADAPLGNAKLSENGATFDELVDRLLAQPTSKADSKFGAIFLALYRKFAAPGRLLDAILQRFDALEQNESAQMIKTVTQLRYLTFLEQWLSQYPGDFAHPETKRRMRHFVAKIATSRISTVAAKEMTNHLDGVHEDDDTDWACADRETEVHPGDRVSLGSTASTLIDDPLLHYLEGMSDTTAGADSGIGMTANRSSSGSSIASSQFMANAASAQKAAQALTPNPRRPIAKTEWRTLMEIPDEIIARELTRMDWIMFSSIRPRDLVRQLSSVEKARCRDLVHVGRMIEHFNHLAAWVAGYVLLRDKPKHRALMMEKMMKIGRKLRELNNYNAVGAIIAGMKSSAVQRLGLTKELIPPTVGRDWARLEVLMGHSRSFSAYRLAWENTTGERIPYLPLHLRDLAGAEQGNASFLGDEKEGRINWKKFEIMGEVVISMQRAQGTPYRNLTGSKPEHVGVKELVLDVRLERDEDVLFERSAMLEPLPGQAGAGQKFKQFFSR